MEESTEPTGQTSDSRERADGSGSRSLPAGTRIGRYVLLEGLGSKRSSWGAAIWRSSRG